MSKYIEFRKGLVSREKRANIIPLNELPTHVDPMKDCYRSLFFYTDEILKYVMDKGSVTGFRGKAGIERIVWDFDHTDLEVARRGALALIERLINEYSLNPSEIGVYFSGRKGFAIEIKAEGIEGIGGEVHENIPVYVKRFCTKLAGDLEGFDRVIYNHNRLYRVAGTLHQKPSDLEGLEINLFKTSIPLDMLQHASMEQIKKYCATITMPQTYEEIAHPEPLSKLAKDIISGVETAVRSAPALGNPGKDGLPDENLAPKGEKICLWRLSQGTVTDFRDASLLRIAADDLKKGAHPSVIRAKISGVRDLMHESDPEKAAVDPVTDEDLDRIIRQVVNNNYDFGCHDDILAKVCSKKCYLAPKVFKEQKTTISPFIDVYRRNVSFFRDYLDNIVPTGFKSLDRTAPLLRGTFNLVVGRPGTGKTSLMLNILKNACKSDTFALFFNLDMSEPMLIQRCAPILMTTPKGEPRFSGKEFMEAHARGDVALMQEADQAFSNLAEKVCISSESSMTVADIAREIDVQEAMTGRKVELVIIDFVQLLKSDKDGLYANSTHNAESLKNLAKEKNICILGLSQPSDRSKGSDQELGLAAAKGSGAWEETVSAQITCWRPFSLKHPEHDWVMTVGIPKNRLGQTGKVDLFWHGPSGIVRDLDVMELEMLESLRKNMDHDKQ